jgi:hypothetical protein
MLATAEARCFTSAEGSSSSRVRNVTEATYVSADTNHSTELIFPGPRMQYQMVISAGSRRYHLKDWFVVNLSYLDDGQVFADHATLPVHGYGEDLSDALNAFCEAFDFQWRCLVEVSEDTLTSGGRNRRATLEAAVKEVVEVET